MFKKYMERLKTGKYNEVYVVETSRGYLINVYKVGEDLFEVAYKGSFRLNHINTVRLLRQPGEVIRMMVQKLGAVGGLISDKEFFDSQSYCIYLYKKTGATDETA